LIIFGIRSSTCQNPFLPEAFFKKLKQRFDVILVDSPSAITLMDSAAISSRVDGIVLVVEAERTRWPVAENVRDRIKNSGGNILGIVLNKRRYYIPRWIYKKL
jgi:protein-tyrosine kinase